MIQRMCAHVASILHNLLTYDIGSYPNDQGDVKAPARSIGEWVSVEHVWHRIMN